MKPAALETARCRRHALSGIGLCLAAAGVADAQVRTDGTVGDSINLPGPTYRITEDLGQIRGANLFHSFDVFSVPENDLALFTGSDAIARVIGRVTSGEPSTIDGRVAVAIAGADLVLINPQGVTFGAGAQLDVQGSVHVATADEVRFADGARFSATEPGAGRLTIAAPESFGFLGGNGDIRLEQTDLTVAPGEALALVGDDVRILDGSLGVRATGADATIQIAAVGGAGEVSLDDISSPGEMSGLFRLTGVRRDAEISDSDVEPPFEDGLSVSGASGSGTIRIRAGRLVVEGGEVRADNLGERDSTARIRIDAADVRLSDNANVRSRAFGDGDAGNVLVNTGVLTLRNGALLRSSTEAGGDAGLVRVLADERILISRDGSNERTEIGSVTLGLGDAGRVLVRSPEIELQDSGTIFSTTRLNASGSGGVLTVRADQILLEGGGQIGSATLGRSRGRGGTVDVTARGALIIRGESSRINPVTNMPEPSGIFTSSESQVSGARRAGNLTVRAGRILLQDRGEIASEGFMNDARAGSVRVTFGDRLTIDDAEITTKASRADAGDITVTGDGIMELRSGGEISTTVFEDESLGDAGTITLGADLAVLNGGVIQANGVIGRGGDIEIAAEQLVRSADSVIEALSDLGIDGSVSLDAPDTDVVGQLTVLPGAFVDASSLLRPGCGDRTAGRGAGTFGSTGQGRLPDGPDAPLVAGYSNAAGPLTITGSFLHGTGC